MSEPGTSLEGAAPTREPGGGQALSAGQRLRQLREEAGVHVAALAAALKVPMRKLQALEADRHDAFPDAAFMRALAASMCRTLKADPAEVLALMPQHDTHPLKVGGGLNAPFKAEGAHGGVGGKREPSRPRLLSVVVALLLLAALAIALWPRLAADDAPQPAPSLESPPAIEQEPAQPPAPGGAAAEPQAPGAAPSEDAAPAAAAPADPVLPTALASPVPSGAPPVLALRARAASWVQVRGGDGAVVFEKVLKAQELVEAPGSAPWSVTVGNVADTEVMVRGKPLDLQALARDNVARFEVK